VRTTAAGASPFQEAGPGGAFTPVWSAADLLRMQRPVAYPRASAFKRLVATVIDAAVSVGLTIPGTIVGVMGSEIGNHGIEVTGISVAVMGGLAGLWYWFARDGRAGGQGLGKEAMGLMVVNLPENRPATARESAVRSLMLPLLGWAVEPLMVLLGKGGRRVGDRLADTQVIRKDDYSGAPPRLPG
jgi:uncharacterized RDD family membrane protein YckC